MNRLPTYIVLLVLTCVAGASGNASEVIAVCPQPFRAALQPWVQLREQEGMSIKLIDSSSSSKQLRESVSKAASDQTKYVLLIGDAPSIGKQSDPMRHVPTIYSATTVTAQWGSTPTLSSDLLYGDFDKDAKPDAVVGRIPASSADDVRSMVNRIQSYESSPDFGPWRGDVQLIAGVGGFGMIADAAIESVTRNIITTVLPTETRTSLYYGSPGHAFYPKNKSFTSAVVDHYREGARFWVYAGHGNVTELDRVPQSAAGQPVLDRRSVASLKCQSGRRPIGLILACYTGAMDASEDCFAENLLKCQGGPVAVFAGSRVTMPYGNTTAAVGLIDAIYHQKVQRLGDAWMSALEQMQNQDPKDRSNTRLMIDTLATVVSPSGTKIEDERAEHMKLYNLLGDPTLKLFQPETLEVTVDPGHEIGNEIEVTVQSPITGKLRVTLDRPLGAIRTGDPNATTVATMTIDATKEMPTKVRLRPAADVTGPLLVRAIVSAPKTWATGAGQTMIRPNR